MRRQPIPAQPHFHQHGHAQRIGGLALFLKWESRSGLFWLNAARQGRFQFGRHFKLLSPVTQVALVQITPLHLYYAGHVPKLSFGRRDAVPIKLVQNDVLSRG